MNTLQEPNVLKCHHATVHIPCEHGMLEGDLDIPEKAHALVLFAHGSGCSQYSYRHQIVARVLRESGIGTLLFSLLTTDEQMKEEVTSRLRFDLEPLADRLEEVTNWMLRHRPHHSIGYFGSGTGASVALTAAAGMAGKISAIVSSGGRPDLAADVLPRILAPTLLIVGELGTEVLRYNKQALAELRCEKSVSVVPGATQLFEESGAMEEVANQSAAWFRRYLSEDDFLSEQREKAAY